MNFFEPTCQEKPRGDKLFGICDDRIGGKSYTNITDPGKWVATVKNNDEKIVVFTAIDKCVIQDHEEVGHGRCDGMLTTDELIYFVELKEVNAGWISTAIEQLESTIKLFISHHDKNKFKHKKAFVCNKKHPRFQVINSEINLRFFRMYGFRIDVQADIIVL